MKPASRITTKTVRFVPDSKGRSCLVFARDGALEQEQSDSMFMRIKIVNAIEKIEGGAISGFVQPALDFGDIRDLSTAYNAFKAVFRDRYGRSATPKAMRSFIKQALLAERVPHADAMRMAKQIVRLGDAVALARGDDPNSPVTSQRTQNRIEDGTKKVSAKHYNDRIGEYVLAGKATAAFNLIRSMRAAPLPDGLERWPAPKLLSKMPPSEVGTVLGSYRNGVVLEFKPHPDSAPQHLVIPVTYLVEQRLLNCPFGEFEVGAELRFVQIRRTLTKPGEIIVTGWKAPTLEKGAQLSRKESEASLQPPNRKGKERERLSRSL